MPDLQIYIAKIAATIFILTYFLFETTAQENNGLTSPFKLCWELKRDNMTSYNLASDNEGNIYLSLLNGKVESINLQTGERKWESEIGGEIISLLLSDGKNIYVVSKIKSKIFLSSLSKNLGITIWQSGFDLDEDLFFVRDNKKLVICSKSGKIFVINKDSGVVIWSRNIEQKLSTTPILFENSIIFGTVSKKIFFFSIENGDIFSQLDVPFPPNIVSIVNDKYLFWGDYRGNIFLSNLITKKIVWKMRGGAEISDISALPQGLLISSLDNFIYLISAKKGKLIWKRRFDGRLLFNPIIVGNYMIVITSASESVNIIDVESGRLVNQFVIENDSYFINAPLVFDDLLVIPTVKGVVGLTNSASGCILKQ